MGLIPPEQVEEIRRRIPLEDLLPEYNVHVIPCGRNKVKALCPFHQEKTPSFYVDTERQLYYCYGCESGGDLFRFVESIDRVTWREAVEMLARRAGVVLTPTHGGGGSRGGTMALYDALELATSHFETVLGSDPRGEPARRYLETRGIDQEMWRRFRLGYSLPSWDGWLTVAEAQSIPFEVGERCGLARRHERGGGGGRVGYDYFRGRLMFPISDPQGRIIGFGARTLEDETPKYLNTPKTPLFDKSQVLYGLARARPAVRRDGLVTIVEGYTDVIMAHQAGLETCVGSLGTAFTRENARQLARIAPRVRMVFDGDAAGQSAAERSLEVLVEEDIEVQVVTVTGGKDPCDAILALGGEEFGRRLERDAIDLFEFKWRCTVGSPEAQRSPAERARAVDEFLRLLAMVPNVVTRKLTLREYSERLEIAEGDLVRRMRQLGGNQRGGAARWADEGVSRAVEDGSGTASEPARLPGDLAQVVLECMITLPARAATIWAEAPRELFEGAAGEAIAEAVEAQLSRNTFSGDRLARDLRDPDAHRIVVKLLSRSGGEDGASSQDHEILWRNCQRDIRRYRGRMRLADLDARVSLARSRGDAEGVQALLLERTRLRKEQKR